MFAGSARSGEAGGTTISFRIPEGWQAAWSRLDRDPFELLTDGPTGTGSTILGSQSGDLTITGIGPDDEAEYCYWTAAPGEALEPVATTMVYVNRVGPRVGQRPTHREACLGGSTEFFVSAEDAEEYWWYWNGERLIDGPLSHAPGVVVSGATTEMVIFDNLTPDAAGQLDCRIIGPEGFDNYIIPAILRVSSNAIAPTITTQPTGTGVTAGQTAGLTAAADAATPDGIVSYQWRRDGVDLVDDGRIVGSNWPTLDIGDATGDDAGVYDCVMTQACGEVISAGAVLTVTRCVFADCDASGVINLDDLDCFVAGFLGSDLATADCDDNGTINLDDIDCFVASFLGGCP
ncbi:MAG: immunoglobulin domain-containing protein [Phycisphaerales bacterium]